MKTNEAHYYWIMLSWKKNPFFLFLSTKLGTENPARIDCNKRKRKKKAFHISKRSYQFCRNDRNTRNGQSENETNDSKARRKRIIVQYMVVAEGTIRNHGKTTMMKL